VQGALHDVRAAGIFVEVVVANVVLQPIQLALTFAAGADVNIAALQARAMVVGYVNSLVPGAPFVAGDAAAQLARVSGLAVNGNGIISPAGNVAVTPFQVVRTTLGLVSAVAAQTDTPIVTGSNPDSYRLSGN
jgi:hypothetical protein